MEDTTTTPVQLASVTLSCSGQGNGHAYCAPVSTIVSSLSVAPSFISISTATTTTTETASGTSPPNIPYRTGTFWQQPQRENKTRSLVIIVPIVGGLLLVGIVIGVWRWKVLKKRRGYPGWRMMGMLGRSRGNGRLGAEGAVVAASGVEETEMVARSSREELERITAANVQATPVAAGSIDAVVAVDNAQARKPEGGGEVARHA